MKARLGSQGIEREVERIRTAMSGKILSLSMLMLLERSTDPPAPAEGQAVMWMSDGTGTGDDGDILVQIKAGGVTKTTTLVDFSAI